jgi:short-chain fatty acids transporter
MKGTLPAPSSSWLALLAQRACTWAERWFPDAFTFALIALAVVTLGALVSGAPTSNIVAQFGSGFWSLIPFTMQMCMLIIGGYVTADSPPVARLIDWLARLPRSGRGAVALVAFVSILLSLLHWGLSLIFSSLLVRALAQRARLAMDYRAAGAATCMGLGSVWALGLSSSAAQLQANPASMPPSLLKITGVIPFSETIFTWQSITMMVILSAVTMLVSWKTAPAESQSTPAVRLGVDLTPLAQTAAAPSRPGEWLDYSPLPSLLLVALGGTWLWREFAAKGAALAISSLNTYNLIFLLLGLLLQWRPRAFLDSVSRSVPTIAGVLVQFPLYGAIGAILSNAANAGGFTLTHRLSHLITRFVTTDSFAIVVGGYSAVLGLFVPSAGGKWLVEAPYVMQAAKDLHYNLGWVVQIYNAGETLANLINPFWMLPVLGILRLRARDLIGYTFVQCLVILPLVLMLLWALGRTFTYHAPVGPP